MIRLLGLGIYPACCGRKAIDAFLERKGLSQNYAAQHIRKEFNYHSIGLGHQMMAAISLIWGTNKAAMTSYENITMRYR